MSESRRSSFKFTANQNNKQESDDEEEEKDSLFSEPEERKCFL